ncbi:hypothetical protein GEMRC1_009101 [Eukaryota sp. GEM-RC1]
MASVVDVSNGEVGPRVYEQMSALIQQFLSPCKSLPVDFSYQYCQLLCTKIWDQFLSMVMARSKSKIHQQLYPNLNQFLNSFFQYLSNFLKPRDEPLVLSDIYPSVPTLMACVAIVTAENPLEIGKKSLIEEVNRGLLFKMLDLVKLSSSKKRNMLNEFKEHLKTLK